MRQRLFFGTGAIILVLAGVVLLRSTGSRRVNEAVDDGLAQMIATLPPGYAASHGATDFNPLTGTLTVHDFAVSHAGAKVWTAETVVLTGADPKALRDVFNPTAYRDGHPAWSDSRLLIGHADVTGLTETPPGPDEPVLHVRRVTLDQFWGRPFVMPPTPENRETPVFALDAAKALAVGGLDISDVDVTLPARDGGHVVLTNLMIKSYRAGNLDQAALHGLAVDGVTDGEGGAGGKKVHLAIGDLALRGVDFHNALENRDPSDPDAHAIQDVRIGSADLESMAATIGPGPNFAIASLSQNTDYSESGDATSRGALKTMQLALAGMPMTPAQKHALDVFGMNEFQIDMSDRSHWRAASRQMTVESDDIVFRGLGTLHIAASVSGVPRDAAKPDPATFLGLTIEKLSLAWDDASLANRLIAVAADSSHITPDAMRQQLTMPLAMLGTMIPDQPDAAGQLGAFLKNPHHLAITLAPTQPVTVAQILAAPMPAKAHLLGLHIEGD